MRKFKKTLYPKTQRFNDNLPYWQITEKLDGSNLTLFKYGGELWIGTRNYAFCYDRPLTEMQEGCECYYSPFKVKQVKKVVETTEWVSVDE